MFCQKCGNKLEGNSKFCPFCGEALSQESNNVVYYNQPAPKTNVLAIIGFVFAFITPFVGLILSIIGLSSVKKNNENGKGFAVAGIVLSAIWLVLQIVCIVLLIAHPEWFDY